MTKQDKHSLSSQAYQQNKAKEEVLYLESFYFWQQASLWQKTVVFSLNLLSYLCFIYFSYLDSQYCPIVIGIKGVFTALMVINLLIDLSFYRLRVGNLRRWAVIKESLITMVMLSSLLL